MARWKQAIIGLALTALAGAAAPLAAQSWAGTAGVGVEVKTRDGRAVESAEIVLVRGEGDERGGPEAVLTDSAGRASVRGLAAGRWLLQVRHPAYMAYAADLRVRAGRRPDEQSATQIKIGDSLESLRVRYFEVEGMPRAAPRGEPAPRPAPPRPAPPSRPSPAPPPVPAPRLPAPPIPPAAQPLPVPQPLPTPQVPAAQPAPAPVPAPMPPPAAQPVPTPVPVPPSPLPQPTPPPPPVAVPMPQPPAPAPSPAPAPPPAPAALPAPAPAATVPPPPAVASAPESRNMRSFREGSCPECQPGEWAVSTEALAATADFGCPDDLAARAGRLAGQLAASPGDRVAVWAGPIDPADLAGPAAEAAGDLLAAGGGCRTLAVHLPRGARFVGFRLDVSDGPDWIQCLPSADCPDARGLWVGNPHLETAAAGALVAAAYEGGGAGRRVRLTAFFVPPGDWRP